MSLAENLKQVQDQIGRAVEQAGRDRNEVRLVAVAKTKPAEIVAEAVRAGAMIIGENYVQEAKAKIDALAELDVSWHFIGRLQTNKAKDVVGRFDLIHSVDRFKLAKELSRRADQSGHEVNILIQINLSGEETKGGTEEAEAIDLIKAADQLPRISVQGLMTMPPFFDDPDRARPYFRNLARLAEQARQSTGLALPHLSMGMSGDFVAAIAEGATLVRVGTAIFGARSYS